MIDFNELILNQFNPDFFFVFKFTDSQIGPNKIVLLSSKFCPIFFFSKLALIAYTLLFNRLNKTSVRKFDQHPNKLANLRRVPCSTVPF